MLAAIQPASAYSVLTHEQIIDLSWKSTILPILLNRFPSLTPEQIRKAHAAAYGGCAIQDLGYYPFGNQFFSDLTHYVRSGDFVRSLFRNAHDAEELAFAIGALTHYIGDTVGHSQAVNRSVAIEFPKLRARYGPSVSYAQGKHAHVQVEFAFDINSVAKRRMPPSGYLHFIGLNVPRKQLSDAFYETYGLKIADVAGLYRTTLRTYRFGVRTFLPAFAHAEALLHRRRFPADQPGPEFNRYAQRVSQLNREAGWDHYRKAAGIRTYLLAGLIIILPKIGPIAMLAIKGPTVDTERLYVESVNLSTAALQVALEHLAPHHAAAGAVTNGLEPAIPPAGLTPNRDLDTGARVVPGAYRLTDETYAKLLETITKNPAEPVPAGLEQDIFRYYADPDAPISTKSNRKKWAKVQQDLQLLSRMPARMAPE